MNDWRGHPLLEGDTVVFPYGWGGQPLSLCEGIVRKFDDEKDRVKVDLTRDNGGYMRRRPWVWVPRDKVTMVGRHRSLDVAVTDEILDILSEASSDPAGTHVTIPIMVEPYTLVHLNFDWNIVQQITNGW